MRPNPANASIVKPPGIAIGAATAGESTVSSNAVGAAAPIALPPVIDNDDTDNAVTVVARHKRARNIGTVDLAPNQRSNAANDSNRAATATSASNAAIEINNTYPAT